ncbi:MAG: SDR family NAD(P)-dependent oxidoreductase [Candidatus Aminicenantes bacterium]
MTRKPISTGNGSESTLTGKEIAVIGMAGRFPGAGMIDEFWQNLKNGVESISFLSERELEEAGVDPHMVKHPNYVKAKGIFENKEYFDAGFFGYTPLEAEILNPQVRIFHECAWETLENAGYEPESYNGSIGLYAGAGSSSYWESLVHMSGKSAEIGEFAAGHLKNKDFINARLSYNLNLNGPVFFLYTACSTSLVAIHLACRGLLMGECKMALAGGITISASPEQGYLYQPGMITSPDGHCRAFDAKAEGLIGGEGGGLVLLKHLKKAISDGDYIYAVVKGSAINNDGNQKVGFTAPSLKSQAEVIQTAQRIARVEPETIGYIETHGTGTTLGDPVEIKALTLAFNTGKRRFCAIGSVKTNIGHLDTGAGVASFIKTVLALKHRLIPPSLHFQSPNPGIDFENSPFYVNTELKQWNNNGVLLRAGVTSLGIGGTNAHVILEEAPEFGPQPTEDSRQKRLQLIVLSARTEIALNKVAENLVDYFKRNPGVNLADAVYTLQVGRRAFKHKKMAVCSTVNETIKLLSSPHSEKVYHFVSQKDNRNVVFMFPGQGSQYVNMGLELYQTESFFREQMDRCFEILKPIMGYDIKGILYPTHPAPPGHPSQEGNVESRGGSPCLPQNCIGSPGQGDHRGSPLQADHINQTEIAQPLLFALEYSLARLMMKWGIKPEAMIGHSIGEYVAACLSGVFSLKDALKLVFFRGQSMQGMPSGAMLSVAICEEELKPLLNDEISLAAVNAPEMCVVSGSHQTIAAFENQLIEKEYKCRRLYTSHAFHSKMMEPILGKYEEKVRQIKRNEPGIPYISNVTGQWITVEQACDPGYWATQVRSTVKFSDGVKELLKKENSIFVEVGPGHSLSAFLKKHTDPKKEHPTLNLVRHPRENISDQGYLLNKIGRLWLYGKRIHWEQFYREEKRNRIPLPIYPFERKRFGIERNLHKAARKALAEKSQDTRNELSDWFYLPSWKRSPLPVYKTEEKAVHSDYLVFINDCSLVSQLVKRLEQTGRDVIVVKIGTAFAKESEETYIINPGKKNDYVLLLKDLWRRNMNLRYIIHLWGVTDNRNGKLDFKSIDRAQELGFYSQLYLVQAIKEQGAAHEFQITVISNNIQDVTGEETLCPEKSTVLGAVKVIPQEFHYIKCASIDIELPEPGSWQESSLVARLMKEISGKSPDPIAAYRNNRRWVQTFERIRLDESIAGSLKLREKGVYLVTGGLGGIGLVLSQYLSKRFKAKMILTGRSPFPRQSEWEKWLSSNGEGNRVGGTIRKLQAIEKMGGEVMAVRADVTNQEEMQEVIRRAEERFGAINGVIHAAGLTRENATLCAVEEVSKSHCQEQFKPKIYGLLVLEKVLKYKKLDFCLLMSSLSSILGGLGFIAYSAVNIFMDAFVQSRNHPDLHRWITVNWDGWQLEGQEDQETPGKVPLKKFNITPGEGQEAFRRILSWSGENQVLVSTRDLQDRIDRWIKLEPLRQDHPQTEESMVQQPRPDLENPYVMPGSRLEQSIADILREYLGIEKVGRHDNFFDLGITSLDTIQINNKLRKLIGRDISAVTMFTYSTTASLSEYLNREQAKGIGVAADNEVESQDNSNESALLLKNTINIIEENIDDWHS